MPGSWLSLFVDLISVQLGASGRACVVWAGQDPLAIHVIAADAAIGGTRGRQNGHAPMAFLQKGLLQIMMLLQQPLLFCLWVIRSLSMHLPQALSLSDGSPQNRRMTIGQSATAKNTMRNRASRLPQCFPRSRMTVAPAK